MSEWVITTIGEICDLTNGSVQTGPFGSDLHASDYSLTGTPVIMPANLRKNQIVEEGIARVSGEHLIRLKNHRLVLGDIVFPRRGDVARYAVIDKKYEGWLCGTGCLRIRFESNSIIDPKYLGYWLGTEIVEKWLLSNAVGTTMPNLNTSILKALPIPLPPLNEQRAIAEILGSLDDKIEANRRMNETLEATARALFKSWFVDFDPVHARSRGEMPAGMDAETAALFPDSFEDSPLGLIPRGWRVGTLGEDFNLTMGQSPPGDTYNDEGKGLPFYQGRRDFGFRYPSLRVYCSQPTRVAQAGDTLVSVRAPVGDVNMAIEECCIGRGVAAIRHKSNSRSYTFYSMLALSEQFQNYDSEGTVFGSISGKDFNNIETILPALEVVHAFENVLYSMDQSIENNELQIRTLAETRDALLPRLVSGELRVGKMDDTSW